MFDKLRNDRYSIERFWNERYKIARPKEFDLDKAEIQALRLFWRKGYAATSIQDLLEAMDLSRSSFYDTFGDKRALFLKVLALYSARVVQRTAQTLNDAPSPTVALQRVFDDLAAGADSDAGAMGCFMVNSVAELVPYDADVAKLATAYNLEMTGLLSKVLARGVKGKTVTRKQTPEQLARYLFNTMQGIRILIKAGATRAQVEAISTLTLNGLK